MKQLIFNEICATPVRVYYEHELSDFLLVVPVPLVYDQERAGYYLHVSAVNRSSPLHEILTHSNSFDPNQDLVVNDDVEIPCHIINQRPSVSRGVYLHREGWTPSHFISTRKEIV